MKIAVYSPYLDTFGGGEKYIMTIAEILASGNSVDVFLDQHLASLGADYLKDELSGRFNLNLKAVYFTKAPVGKGSSFWKRLFFLKHYDILFYLTDGSIFFPTAKKNILHIQSPLAGETDSLWRKIKLSGWGLIIYNSAFTRQNSQNNWPIKSKIVYPPVDTDKIKPLKKQKYILSVGRFFGFLKDKKHEILIRVFKELFETGKINGWSLHLAGSAGQGDKDYLECLKKLAKKLPVEFYPNLGYDKLVALYGQSDIYWHAAGFGEKDPVRMEHFGISTVEAMAGGCVPVVIGKGGQREIVEHGRSGYLWESAANLKKLTLELIENNGLRREMAGRAIRRAKDFSKEDFENNIMRIAKNR